MSKSTFIGHIFIIFACDNTNYRYDYRKNKKSGRRHLDEFLDGWNHKFDRCVGADDLSFLHEDGRRCAALSGGEGRHDGHGRCRVARCRFQEGPQKQKRCLTHEWIIILTKTILL